MPNWCNNEVSITGPKDKIETLWNDAKTADNGEFGFLNVLRPEVISEEYDQYWRVNNWGTKWDISDEGLEFSDLGDGTASISGYFDSAWAPPEIALDFYALNNPDVSIDIGYNEPGMCFVGRASWKNGTKTLEESHDYTELTASEVRGVIGEELDDAWGISELMSEWEAENDDVTYHDAKRGDLDILYDIPGDLPNEEWDEDYTELDIPGDDDF